MNAPHSETSDFSSPQNALLVNGTANTDAHDVEIPEQAQAVIIKRIGNDLGLSHLDGMDPKHLVDESRRIEAHRPVPKNIDDSSYFMLRLMDHSKKSHAVCTLFKTPDIHTADKLVDTLATKTVDFVVEKGDFTQDPNWDEDGNPLGELRQEIFNHLKAKKAAGATQTTNVAFNTSLNAAPSAKFIGFKL